MTNLEVLLQNKLSVDWTTIDIGWQQNFVSSEEVVRYAVDQIGYCRQEDNELVADLAFADTTNWCAIRRCLEKLRAGETTTTVEARRVLRWARLKNTADEMNVSLPSVHDEWFDEAYELEMVWWGFPEQLDYKDSPRFYSGQFEGGQSDYLRQIVEIVGKWLQVEREVLLAGHGGDGPGR